MARLTGHPDIVGALQVGVTEHDRLFVVMEYHRHGSLDEHIRRVGPLPLEDALRLGTELAGALETAHRLGIVHRDVNPANILFDDYGEPRLTDFGYRPHRWGFRDRHRGGHWFTCVYGSRSALRTFSEPGIGHLQFGCDLSSARSPDTAARSNAARVNQLVAQFLRITTGPVPDLRENGVAGDVAAVIEQAMASGPENRQLTAAELSEDLRTVQRRHGSAVDDMAVQGDEARRVHSCGRVPDEDAMLIRPTRCQRNLPPN